ATSSPCLTILVSAMPARICGSDMPSAAHRKYRASLARENALFFYKIQWQKLDTYFRRVVLDVGTVKRSGCVTHRFHRVTKGHSHNGYSVFCCQWSTPSDHGTTRTVVRQALQEQSSVAALQWWQAPELGLGVQQETACLTPSFALQAGF